MLLGKDQYNTHPSGVKEAHAPACERYRLISFLYAIGLGERVPLSGRRMLGGHDCFGNRLILRRVDVRHGRRQYPVLEGNGLSLARRVPENGGRRESATD